MDEVFANFSARRTGLVRALTSGTHHRRDGSTPRSCRTRDDRLTRDLICPFFPRADVERFYAQCDPDKENLCLYGNPDGTWEVQLPAEEVPPELPEPALGINFARDGMQVRLKRDSRLAKREMERVHFERRTRARWGKRCGKTRDV